MFFSIIVPAYNVENYIDRCIKSLINQDINDYEIIIVNDGSTDSTEEKILKWDNTKITFINKKSNTGLSDSRNLGLKNARGEYILFVDSDDYLEYNSLSNLKSYIEEVYPTDVVYMGYVKEKAGVASNQYDFHSKFNKCYSSHEFMKFELQHRGIPIPACFAVYRRGFLIEQDISFEVGLLHEDELWAPTVMLYAKSIATTNLSLYHYILRDDSITQKKDKVQNGLDLLHICQQLMDLSINIQDNELQKLMKNHIAMVYMKAMCIGKLYRKEYKVQINHLLPLRNVCFPKDMIKGFIFAISLRGYYLLDYWMGHKI